MADEQPRAAAPDAVPNGLTAFAAQWAVAVLRTTHIPVSRAEVEVVLRDIAVDLTKLVRAEQFDARHAEEAGRRLVAEQIATSAALTRTLHLLSTQLLPATGLPETQPWLGRLAELTSHLAAGYLEAVRDRLFDQQEMIKTAVFRARESSERARLATEARFRAVFQSTAVGIAITDLGGRIELTNPALSTILSRSDGDLAGQSLLGLIHRADVAKANTGFTEVVNGRRSKFVRDISFADPDGEQVWTRLSATLVRDEFDEQTHMVTMVEDISDLHLLRHDQLVHALRDQLTGLPNRTQFMSTLDETLRNATEQDRVALCYVDLDGFKIVNDGIGHEFGDQMLVRVANMLRDAFPEPTTTVARVGGDGFGILVTGTRSGFDVSERIAEALEQLTEPVYVDNETGVAVSASVGIVERPAFGLTAAELVQAAEVTTHRAKANGKAQWELYDPDLDARDRGRFRLGASIPGALETNEFVVTFQPVAQLTDRALVGLHASVYWEHPKLGKLRPIDFLDLAEETGFIVPLGRWVIEQVGAWMAKWSRDFGDRMPTVGVNLSPRLAREQDLIKILREVIEQTGLPADKLHLGVPSDVAIDRYGEPLDNLAFFESLGIKVVISSFGNGNVGMVNLRELPIDGVSTSSKLTKAFGAAPENSPFEKGIRHLVRLTDELRIPMVANGVDTAKVAKRLVKVGARLGAGPLFGPPGTPEEAERLITAGSC